MARREVPAGACPRTGQVGRHTDSCYRVVRNCGKFEHSHSQRGCYKQDGTLKCSSQEHSHGNACNTAEGPNCGGV